MIFKKKRIVIAGGSGFLGTSLAHFLTELGYQVTILTRRQQPEASFAKYVLWDGRTVGDWKHELSDSVAVINLAGRSVNCIKNPENQDEILRSRVESTSVLGKAMKQIANPPPVWIQMATAHIYGDSRVSVCDDDSPFGIGLAPTVGRRWEETFWNSALANQRKVVLRTSFVIGKNRGNGGGALTTLSWITRFGLGGKVGQGGQGMSWIHEEDLNRIFADSIENNEFEGSYVASSPNPVSQKNFMKSLRKTLRTPIGLPAANWMVRFGAHYLLRTDPDLILYGRYVRPKRLLQQGFEFKFPRLEEALIDLC